MACRFPGGADDLDSYWSILESGVDATSEIPAERWNVDELYSAERAEGMMSTRRGGFVRDMYGFDAAFFGISEAEARGMDPQHRMLLETTWTALEDAGVAPLSLRGSRTGVFVGPAQNEYLAPSFTGAGYGGVNSLLCMAAGRIAHFLDLAGPVVALDTACSSSLVALHMACQSLAAGECDMAVVAASQAIVNPIQHLLLSEIDVLSPDGRCKTFAEDADGFARSEGNGALIVMPRGAARERGMTERAVVRATAINHDGHTPALIAPSATAQHEVLELALRKSGMRPEDITFVETHGTGTPVGDPKEVEAIMAAFGAAGRNRLTLGAVKTNLGHLEQAAGMAGLIKTVLNLQRCEIAPNLHAGSMNPALDLAGAPARVPVQRVPWQPSAGGRRLAGVSGFGFSGTNAHVLLEQGQGFGRRSETERTHQLLCLSAKTDSVLGAIAGNLDRFLRASPSAELADVAYTLGVGRSPFERRAAIVCSSAKNAREGLSAAAAGRDHNNLVVGRAVKAPRVAFLYSGQGSQTPGMGRHLFDSEPVFRDALTRCAELLDGRFDQPLFEVMFGNGGTIHDTRYAQPCLFAFQYAMTALLASWGIVPDAVIGHSIGEYAAACTADVLSLEDALWLVERRSSCMASAQPGGAMVAFSAPAEQMAELLAPFADVVGFGAINSPRSTVLSGDSTAIDHIIEAAEALDIRTTRLTVSHAFHSPHMDSILDEFENSARQIHYGPPRLPLMCNLTGLPAEPDTLDSRYFRDHVRQPVQFGPGVASLAADGCNVFVEIGPHPVLSPLVSQLVPDGHVVGTQVRGRDGAESALRAAASLYCVGVQPDWSTFFAGREQQRIPLPTMPFERKPFWLTDRGPMWSRSGPENHLRPLAQKRSPAPPDPDLYTTTVDFEQFAYLADHRVAGTPVFPGAAFVEMMLEALQCEWPDDRVELRGVIFERAAVLPDDGRRTFCTRFELDDSGAIRVEVFGRHPDSPSTDESWERHATAMAVLGTAGDEAPASVDTDVLRQSFGDAIDIEKHYADMAADGLDYGESFRGLRTLQGSVARPAEAVADVVLPGYVSARSYLIHPALLDACLHAIGAAQRGLAVAPGAFLPVGVDRIELGRGIQVPGQGGDDRKPLCDVLCHVRVRPTSKADALSADIDVHHAGVLAMRLHGLALQRADSAALRKLTRSSITDAFLIPVWEKAAEIPAAHPDLFAGQSWLVIGGEDELTRSTVAALKTRDVTPTLLTVADDGRDGAVEPGCPESAARAVGEVLSSVQRFDRVVCLWPAGLEAGPTARAGVSHADDSLDVDATTAILRSAAGGVLHVAQTLLSQQGAQPPDFTVVTRGAHRVLDTEQGSPVQAAVWGLGRVIGVEHPELHCSMVDLDSGGDAGVEEADALLASLQSSDREWQAALRGKDRFVFRLSELSDRTSLDRPSAPAYALTSRMPGVLDELALEPCAAPAPADDELQLSVEAAGVNFRDVMNALGVYPGDPEPLGNECAARVTAVGAGVSGFAVGDPVIALTGGAFRSIVNAKAARVVARPSNLTAAHAATLPVAFLTAEHALTNLAKLRPGETILIHAAAGGVGQAAVQCAQAYGAKIIATAGSRRKRALLHARGVAHVLDSRTLDFEHQVLELTEGRGVDVVLNSLANEFVPATLRTMASGGRFVEIGKVTVLSAAEVPEGIRYFHFDLNDLCDQELRTMLDDVLVRIGRGDLHPLPTQQFDATDAVQAFRHMAGGRHVGKLALRFGQCAGPEFDAGPGTYLVTGGLGALGQLTAQTLLDAGASNVVLTGRNVTAADVADSVHELDPTGRRLVVLPCDVADRDQVDDVVHTIRSQYPPLRGIIHAAGVLDDRLLTQQTWESMQQVLAAKVAGAQNLHAATLNAGVDYFVMFSSVTALLGTVGQANYATANAYMDALAHHRRSHGLPAVSINWGGFGDIGMAARDGGALLAAIKASGIDPIAPPDGAEAFTALLGSGHSQVAVLPANWGRYLPQAPEHLRVTLSRLGGAVQRRRSSDAGGIDLSSATVETVAALIENEIRKMLYLDPEFVIDAHASLEALGLDSLMAVELRNTLGRRLGLTLSATLLFDYPSLSSLADHLAYDQLGLGTDTDADTDVADDVVVQPISEVLDEDVVSDLVRQIESLPETAQRDLLARILEG